MGTRLTHHNPAASLAWELSQRWAKCSQCGTVERTVDLDAELYHVVEQPERVFDTFLCERCQKLDESRDYERRG